MTIQGQSSADISMLLDESFIAPEPTSIVSDNGSSTDQNVRVVVRIRPLSTKELNERSKEAISVDQCTVFIGKNRNFEYDNVFTQGATQSDVYEKTAGDVIRTNIFKGFNVTILAYGQTGSGKTFTMGTEGGQGCADENDENNPNAGNMQNKSYEKLPLPASGDGIIPRAVYDLFNTASKLKKGRERVKIEMSYLEIYNEEARDLLCFDTSGSDLLHIRDSKEGVIVQNLSSIDVNSPREVGELMQSASRRRATASTAMNAVSSRSHAICTLNVTIAPLDDDEATENDAEEVRAKLTLVDLAGSERIKRTGAEGARMKEGININKGLFVLGQVVSALSELGQQQSSSMSNAHIPYRDSKLTRLLQDSLGGNSRTVMVACVSPADSNVEESINTLRYAQRTRNIKNSAVRNVVVSAMSPAEAAALRRENQMLKLQLLQAKAAMNSMPSSMHMFNSKGDDTQNSFSSKEYEVSQQLQGMNIEKLEVVSKLRATCSSLESKIDQMESQVQSAVEDALTASLKADKWQLKYEQVKAKAATQGIDLPEKASEEEDIVSQLRNELSNLRSELQEAVEDAAVARATAAAIVAGDGNLTEAEKLALASVDEVESSEGTSNEDEECLRKEQCKQLTSELLNVSSGIEKKEAMISQMNRERECMEAMKTHFENAVRSLQDEVGALSAEKKSLMVKVQSSEGATRKRPAEMDNPETKKMREKINALETRIKELKSKASEHARSLRMREAAEKKCNQLAAEISQDKKRRAALQRKLKAEASERRAEKKAADKKAARLLRDGQKLKYELQKVKQVAAKQEAVLRRKAAEAAQRQKMLADQQRKRNNASSMRFSQSKMGGVTGGRKDEIIAWFENEYESALALKEAQEQIDDHDFHLQESAEKKEELLSMKKRGLDIESVLPALKAVEEEIEMRTGIIEQLKKNMDEISRGSKVHGSSLSHHSHAPSSCFQDTSTWQGLTRTEVRFLYKNVFERLLIEKRHLDTMRDKRTNVVEKAVNDALAKERRACDDIVMKLKMQHSEVVMTLLESTKGAMEQEVRLKALKASDGAGIDPSFQTSIDSMLNSYFDGCNKVGQTVKKELMDVKEKQDVMEKMVHNVAEGLIAKNEESALLKKKKKMKRKSPKALTDDEFDFDEDDLDAGQIEDSDDSDWSPETPVNKKRRGEKERGAEKKTERKTEKKKDAVTFASDDDKLVGENILQNQDKGEEQLVPLNTMKVAELKALLRQRGLAVSGKKADLLRRLRTQTPGDASAIDEIDSDQNEENRTSVPRLTIDTSDKALDQRQPLTSISINKSKKKKKSVSIAKKARRSKSLISPRVTRSSFGKDERGKDLTSSSPESTSGRSESSSSLMSPRKRVSAPIITQSAKKRRRKNMAAAVSRALITAEELEKSL